jgi:hypothetical protein
MLKTAALAPIANVKIITAVTVNPGALIRRLQASLKSVSIIFLLR